ncbi:MAG: DUF3445 domain-containing protein [Planctomycetota bacterium]|nr:DUF3445 domain-containing protein [Planctomycetota bacterium]
MEGDSSKLTIDWSRVLPFAEHRWSMGLRPGNVAAFIAHWDPTGEVLRQRVATLTDAKQAEPYAMQIPAAEPAIYETAELVRSHGVDIPHAAQPLDQLLLLGRGWESDFVLLHEDEHGEPIVVGGVVCFPSSWSLREKLGMRIEQTHQPVPGLNQTLGRQIDTFLKKLRPGEAWVRGNTNFSRDPWLDHLPGQPRLPFDPSINAEEFWIRFEHQLLLRLPQSGSVLFGIRVENIPITHLAANSDAIARLAAFLDTMSSDIAQYKNIDSARKKLLEIVRELGPAS